MTVRDIPRPRQPEPAGTPPGRGGLLGRLAEKVARGLLLLLSGTDPGLAALNHEAFYFDDPHRGTDGRW